LAIHLRYYALKMHPGMHSLLPAGNSTSGVERHVFSYIYFQALHYYYDPGYENMYVPQFCVLTFRGD